MKGSLSIGIAGCIFYIFLWSCTNELPPAEMEMTDSCSSIPVRGSIRNNITRMPQPVFSETAGSVAYGTRVYMLADSVPPGGVFELSTDSGRSWKAARCFLAQNSGNVWARTRFNTVSSAITKAAFSVFYKRVLIIGNSITRHGPAPQIGWNGNWGMAASSPEKDYLHIITKKLQLLHPDVEIRVLYDIGFEQNYWKFDYGILKPSVDYAPDLIIMRIGENTDMDHVNEYDTRYGQYLTELTSKTTAKVICTTSFWNTKQDVSEKIKVVAKNRGYILADFQPFTTDRSYAAYNLFQDGGVGSHPSDKGMQAIADCISKYF